MDQKDLVSNEREWRLYLVNKVDSIEAKVSHIAAWTLVYRIVGGSFLCGMFAFLMAWVEYRLANH